MKSPYPYFGGKSTIMPEVWRRLGDTLNFVDPFLGSNAPLLSRPGWDWEAGCWADGKNRMETVNDKDCFVSNFWRAINADPEQVASFADWPVNEADLHARHRWLVENENFIERMKSDPDYYDAKVAGWWVWGISQWIGGGWCVELSNKRSHLASYKGVHRGLLHRRRPHLTASNGVHSLPAQRPILTRSVGVHSRNRGNIYTYFDALSARLRRVRVCCGDWARVLGPTPTYHNGLTAVILDPPYGHAAGRANRLYAVDSLTVADAAREWAIANGDNPKLRIALFGYEDEHSQAMPDDWEALAWKAHGGYSNRNSNGNDNKHKERVWFSPHCLKVNDARQLSWDFVKSP